MKISIKIQGTWEDVKGQSGMAWGDFQDLCMFHSCQGLDMAADAFQYILSHVINTSCFH